VSTVDPGPDSLQDHVTVPPGRGLAVDDDAAVPDLDRLSPPDALTVPRRYLFVWRRSREGDRRLTDVPRRGEAHLGEDLRPLAGLVVEEALVRLLPDGSRLERRQS